MVAVSHPEISISEKGIRNCFMLFLSQMGNSELYLQSLKCASLTVHGYSTYKTHPPEKKTTLSHGEHSKIIPYMQCVIRSRDN